MIEFVEKNWPFLIFITCLGSFVIYSVIRDRKRDEKKQKEESLQTKIEESQKKEK